MFSVIIWKIKSILKKKNILKHILNFIFMWPSNFYFLIFFILIDVRTNLCAPWLISRGLIGKPSVALRGFELVTIEEQTQSRINWTTPQDWDLIILSLALCMNYNSFQMHTKSFHAHILNCGCTLPQA